jgi:hypothetical protein
VPIKKMYRSLFSARRGRSDIAETEAVYDLPVCAAEERNHFLTGAATPPSRRGDCHTVNFLACIRLGNTP